MNEAEIATLQASHGALDARVGRFEKEICKKLSGIFAKLETLSSKSEVNDIKSDMKGQEDKIFDIMKRPSWATVTIIGSLIGLVSALITVILGGIK